MEKVLRIVFDQNEKVEFYYGDDYIMSVNHDEHGWSGMSAVEDAVVTFAEILGIKVVRE